MGHNILLWYFLAAKIRNITKKKTLPKRKRVRFCLMLLANGKALFLLAEANLLQGRFLNHASSSSM